MGKPMGFRTKMILSYATLSLLVSLGLGYYGYFRSAAYERESHLQEMEVAAKTCLYQMEDLLNRMDAILYYVISDPETLEGITLLSRGEEGAPTSYQREARETISLRISTEYIRDNSYRTVFFNPHGFFTSSTVKVKNDSLHRGWRLRESFSLEELSYLPLALEGRGKSVIIPPHLDYWGAGGEVWVFSLMKALQGEGMGYLEAEYRLEDLSFLRVADPEMDLQVRLEQGEVLYCSQGEKQENWLYSQAPDATFWRAGGYEYVLTASQDYSLSVVTRKSVKVLGRYQRQVFFTSFSATLLAFFLSLLMIIYWSKHLTAPILRLKGVVDQTNLENLEATGLMEGEKTGIDEFTQLTHAFQAMTRRMNLAIQKERRAEMLQLQAQFDVLQTQVNPHFIYNVLNIISARAVMADDEVICEMCGCLAGMLRYSTNNKVRQASVGEELEYLKSYFFLLKCRYEDKLSVRVDIPEGLKEKPLPKMTLQQVVENSIKHGFHDTDLNMELEIKGQLKKEGWLLTVRDNGPGVREEVLSSLRERFEKVRRDYEAGAVRMEAEIGGMGLANTYARCLLAYGSVFTFALKNLKEGGFEVSFGCLSSPQPSLEPPPS